MNSPSGTEPASAPKNASESSWRWDRAWNSAISAGVGGLSAASRAVKSYIGRAALSRARWYWPSALVSGRMLPRPSATAPASSSE